MLGQELENNFYQPETNLISLRKKLRIVLDRESISNKQVFEAVADGFASLQVYDDVRCGRDAIPSLPRYFVYERTAQGDLKREERAWIQYGDPVVFIHRNKYGKLYVSRDENISDTLGMYGKRYDLTNQDRIDIVEIVYRGIVAPDFRINPI